MPPHSSSYLLQSSRYMHQSCCISHRHLKRFLIENLQERKSQSRLARQYIFKIAPSQSAGDYFIINLAELQMTWGNFVMAKLHYLCLPDMGHCMSINLGSINIFVLVHLSNGFHILCGALAYRQALPAEVSHYPKNY